MSAFIFAVVLVALMLLGISLNRTYEHFTSKEIKRQARRGDARARELYKPVSYGASLQVFLWLIVLLSAAGACVLFATTIPGWLAFILIAVTLAMGFWWLPAAEISSLNGRMAVWCAPLISKCLYYLHPLLTRVGRLVKQHYPINVHAGLYEKEDLLELLEWQKQQPENRIPTTELDVMERALLFSDKTVQDIAVPRRKVRFVAATDTVGPIVIDELHKTGHSSFPVYEGKRDNIIGTLYLRDLVHLRSDATASQVMRHGAFYVQEAFSLNQALDAFLRTKHHLLMVVNSLEECTGVITMEDVLEQVVGKPTANEFDGYDNLQEVASFLTKNEPEEEQQEADLEVIDDQPSEDVVE
jgi:CBS domain containing-hemolysin-like protein